MGKRDGDAKAKPKTLLTALEDDPGGRGGQCMICKLAYRADVDKALRIALTGRWTVMQVWRQMQKTQGFQGGYGRLLTHARQHLGGDA